MLEPITIVETLWLSPRGLLEDKHTYSHSRLSPLNRFLNRECWAEINYSSKPHILWFSAMRKADPKYYHKFAFELISDARFVNTPTGWLPRGSFPFPSPYSCRIEIMRSQWCLLRTQKPHTYGDLFIELKERASRTFTGNYLLLNDNGTLSIAFENHSDDVAARVSFS